MTSEAQRRANAKYAAAHKKEKAEYMKRYYQNNKDRIKEQVKGYQSSNRAYATTKSNYYHQKTNDETKKTAVSHYKRWTPEEITRLEIMIERGMSYKEIAIELGRSAKAIHGRICILRKKSG